MAGKRDSHSLRSFPRLHIRYKWKRCCGPSSCAQPGQRGPAAPQMQPGLACAVVSPGERARWLAAFLPSVWDLARIPGQPRAICKAIGPVTANITEKITKDRQGQTGSAEGSQPVLQDIWCCPRQRPPTVRGAIGGKCCVWGRGWSAGEHARRSGHSARSTYSHSTDAGTHS